MPQSDDTPVRGDWTDARVAKLRDLWREGLSASTVAARLGVSRNAVIGKVHRLGLSKSGEHDSARPRLPARPKAPRRASRARPKPAPRPALQAPVHAVDLPGLVGRLEALGAQACHFPIGDPKSDDFAFCGRKRSRGPYCAAHAAVAFRPVPPAQDRRANRGVARVARG